MARFKVPYLKWRDGRPRWEPGPALRARGFKGRDLRDEAGEWLGMADAITEAQRLNAEASAPRKPKAAPAATGRLLADAWRAYVATPDFRGLRPSSQRDYIVKAKVFLEHMGDFPLPALRRKLLLAYWRRLHDERGHAMANGTLAILRRCLAHAVDEEWLAANPAGNLRIKTLPPRVVYWTPEECERLVAAADAMDEHGVGDAVVIALHTAQRQGDVLAMPAGIIDGGAVRLKQAKTGQLVEFPATDILQRRVAAALARQRARAPAVISLQEAARQSLVIDDRTGQRFNSHTFRHRFAEVRAAAGFDAGKTFQDLRDTAITRLYLSGLSILRIASISGHDIASVDRVLRHYVALTADDGRSAIDAYETWLTRQGVKV